MTQEDATVTLDELRALEAAATPGPWEAESGMVPDDLTLPRATRIYARRDAGPYYPGFLFAGTEVAADAAFIVAAVQYVRDALSVEGREAQVERITEVLGHPGVLDVADNDPDADARTLAAALYDAGLRSRPSETLA